MNLLNNLTVKDKRALLLYLGVTLMCAACFAAGIFVGRTTQPSYAAHAGPAEATSFTVRVLALSSSEEAERLSAVLRERGQASAAVDRTPGQPGHAVKIGPFTAREAADELTQELRSAGYGAVQVVAETRR